MIKITQKELFSHFYNDLGIIPGDYLFVFSSLRGLGKMEKSEEGVLEVLESIVSEGGLFFPTFTYSWNDKKIFSPESNYAPLMGKISEKTIGRPEYVRTLHPNFSVNLKIKDAGLRKKLIKINNDTFGKGSIFHNIYDEIPETKILLLGGVFPDSLFRCTFVHTAQQIENAWYRYTKKILNPNNSHEYVTQFSRYYNREEYMVNNSENSKHSSYNFPIKESFDEYGEILRKFDVIKIEPIGYCESKLVTVKDTINLYRQGLNEDENFGLIRNA